MPICYAVVRSSSRHSSLLSCRADAASEARQQDVARSRDEVQAGLPAFSWVVSLSVAIRPLIAAHRCCQVLLAAWILDVDLDEVRVASFLFGLSAEMKVV